MSKVNNIEEVEEIVEAEVEETEIAEVEEPKGIKGFIKKHPFWTGVITATGIGGVIVGGALIAGAVNAAKAESDMGADGMFDADDLESLAADEA